MQLTHLYPIFSPWSLVCQPVGQHGAIFILQEPVVHLPAAFCILLQLLVAVSLRCLFHHILQHLLHISACFSPWHLGEKVPCCDFDAGTQAVQNQPQRNKGVSTIPVVCVFPVAHLSNLLWMEAVHSRVHGFQMQQWHGH